VVIAGGGIAGLETALALRDLAPDETDVALVSPEPDFVLKPLVVEEPFTKQPAEHHELGPLLDGIGARYVRGALHRVDVDRHVIRLGRGADLPYDILVVCIGARARPAYRSAETFWSTTGDLPVDRLIRDARHSHGCTLALVVPPGTSWPLPLYELALLTRRRSEELQFDDLRLRLVTPEPEPLAIFGRRASDAVAALLAARRVGLRTNSSVVEDEHEGLHVVPGGTPVRAGVVLALPSLEGPCVAGLPADPHGFVPVDEYGRVEDSPDVYAAGDGTNFPVKQGGLATQQADAVAEHIAARLGAHVDAGPFRPHLRGQLITGAESLHMKHELTGGHGEGVASLDYLWWPPQKVSGRYLSAWLGHETGPADLEPPFRPLDVEVSWPHEWHREPLAYDAETPPRR
jgi:sulfide:quinone oxidoreductase